MAKQFVPKTQSKVGQIVDSIFILVLVYVSLFIPLLLQSESAADAAKTGPKPTWDSLHVAPVIQEQWVKLGFDAEKAAPIINSRFDYTIDPMMLVITIAVILGYFFFMLRTSDRQYKDVIEEKFGPAKR